LRIFPFVVRLLLMSQASAAFRNHPLFLVLAKLTPQRYFSAPQLVPKTSHLTSPTFHGFPDPAFPYAPLGLTTLPPPRLTVRIPRPSFPLLRTTSMAHPGLLVVFFGEDTSFKEQPLLPRTSAWVRNKWCRNDPGLCAANVRFLAPSIPLFVTGALSFNSP